MPSAPRADRTPIALSAGNQYTCALIDGGGVICWGRNWEGQLGIGSSTSAGSSPESMGAALKTVDLGSELPSNLPSRPLMCARDTQKQSQGCEQAQLTGRGSIQVPVMRFKDRKHLPTYADTGTETRA